MRKLSDFGDYDWVAKRMNDYRVQPVIFTSKKGINQYRQREEANTQKSLQFVSADFDLIWFPIRGDIPEMYRRDFVLEMDLLSWLMGKYTEPAGYHNDREQMMSKTLNYKPLPEWLKSMKIDPKEKRKVKIQLLVSQLEPTIIPDTVHSAHTLGMDVRRFKKQNDKQPRGCVIDGRGKNPRVYHVFKDFKPGEVKMEEMLPGFPQIAVEEGKRWWGLATDDSKYVDFYLDMYEKEAVDSPTYGDVLQERAPIEEIHRIISDADEASRKIKTL